MVVFRIFDLDQALGAMDGNGTRNLIFACPVTDLNVQHRFEARSGGDHDYESVTCLACGGVHFINRSTGKVLRRDSE
jgi:hypothetical protein